MSLGNRTPLAILESLNHSFKNKRLILFGRNTVTVRKDKWHTYEEKGKQMVCRNERYLNLSTQICLASSKLEVLECFNIFFRYV